MPWLDGSFGVYVLPSVQAKATSLYQSPERIFNGQLLIDDLAVLQTFRIKRGATGFESGSGDQRIIDAIAVLLGNPERRFMRAQRNRYWRRA